MSGGVRYQIYESADGHVLFMASEQAFWKNFCEGVGRADLFEAHPGSKYADHARGNTELRKELRDIFATRTTQEWIAFGIEVNTPIAPVNTTEVDRRGPAVPRPAPVALPRRARVRAAAVPGEVRRTWSSPSPTMAPTLGQHTDEILADVLGYDDDTAPPSGRPAPSGPGHRMNDVDTIDLVLLVVRVAAGITLALHGYQKFFMGGRIQGTAGWFESLGMKPGRLHAYLAACTEITCGIGFAVGLLTPLTAAGVRRDHDRGRLDPQGQVLHLQGRLGVQRRPRRARGPRRHHRRRGAGASTTPSTSPTTSAARPACCSP